MAIITADSKYLAELSALQRWIKETVNIDSYRLTAAPPQLARPVVLWEAPTRGKDRSINRWAYVNKVTQYGKLYVAHIDQLAAVQDTLMSDLEERVGVLPLYGGSNGGVVTILKRCEITFNTAENLNIPFNVVYEVTYARVRPAPAPHATSVANRFVLTTKY